MTPSISHVFAGQFLKWELPSPMRTTGLVLTDAHNGLRVLSRAAAERINLAQAGMAHASELPDQIARYQLSYVERL